MMKPKQYKEIPDKEKKEVKINYKFAKLRTEKCEEEKKDLEKMCPLEYLSVLNSETK